MACPNRRSARRETNTGPTVCPPICVTDRTPSANHDTAIPEDPPTPLWELILEQFKDQLVLILLGSAPVSFVLALFEEDGGWTAFVDPVVVRLISEKPVTVLGADSLISRFSQSSSSMLS